MRITNANGRQACLLHLGYGQYVIRVFDDVGRYQDYDIQTHDLMFTIIDGDAYLHEDNGRQWIAPKE